MRENRQEIKIGVTRCSFISDDKKPRKSAKKSGICYSSISRHTGSVNTEADFSAAKAQ